MTFFEPTRRRVLRGALALLILGIGLAGCSRSDQPGEATSPGADTLAVATDPDQPDAAPAPAPTGEPIADTAYAVIVSTPSGSDTLATTVLEAQAQNYEERVQLQQPGTVLSDAERRQVRQGIAEEFIRRTLLLAEAARRGFTADPARIDTGIDQIIAQNRMADRAALEQAMAEQGVTMDSLRSFLEEEVLLQMIQEQMVEGAAQPTDAEIEAFSRAQGKEVWAQHILLNIEDPAQDAAVRQRAAALIDSAEAGADFFALARRHSQGPSAPTGGDLGYFAKSDMIPPFAEAAFALADSGDVYPEPVKTSFGYHVIRLLGQRDAPPIDTSRARILLMQNRQREAYEKTYNALRAATVIRVNAQVLGSDFGAAAGS